MSDMEVAGKVLYIDERKQLNHKVKTSMVPSAMESSQSKWTFTGGMGLRTMHVLG